MMKPLANLSLDLDNKWAYLRAAGRADWAERPGYFDLVIPRIVEHLGDVGLPLSVFVVGRDLENDHDTHAIKQFKQLTAWEFANHSYNHLPWLHTMQPDEVAQELDRTAELIETRLGHRPLGFRGPGFSCPEEVLRLLVQRGYHYDASVFPTSLAPVARAVFLMRSGLNEEQREKASKLYGGWSSVLQRNRPFVRSIGDRSLWELPVTTMPLARTPIHFSYVTFLAGFSVLAAKAYFLKALILCRLTGTSPSLLLHPPDFMGAEDDTDMAYFPAMSMPREKKLRFMKWALKELAKRFEVQTMANHAATLNSQDASRIPQTHRSLQPTHD